MSLRTFQAFLMTTPALSQDELKTLVGQAALQYVVPGEIVGVGTGSTVNKFIDALATIKDQIKAAWGRWSWLDKAWTFDSFAALEAFLLTIINK